MTPPSDETEQFAPDPEPAPDTGQFPVTRVESEPAQTRPQHAVTSGTEDASGISRAGWWAITISAAVLLILGFLLTFGPARYWTPVPVVFLGYFLISGVIGLVFWKGVRELQDSNPTLHSGDGPASPGARVAAAVGAVGVASALVLLPAGLTDAPVNALPCPDGSNTCGPTAPTFDPGPTQGGGQTAPQAPQTTIPGYTPPNMPTPPTQGTPNDGGNIHVQTPDFGTPGPNDCILNCGPTQAPQAPQTGQGNPAQTGQQNPVTTAPNTPATTPRVPTSTPKLRTPAPETTTSTTRNRTVIDRVNDDRDENKDEDRPGWPNAVAELAAVAGTYRRRTAWANRMLQDGRVVADDTMTSVMRDATVVSKPTDWEDDRRAKWDKTMQYMFDEMKNNPSTDTFQKVKGAADTRNSSISLALGGNPMLQSAGAVLEVFAPGRTWDHKPKIQNLTNTFTDDGLYFQPPYGDNTVYYDFFSNVHYGYIMNLAGWPLDETLKGQDVPILSGKQAPWDTMASQAGWELAQREGRDLTWGEYNQAIQSLVQQFEAAKAAGTTMTNLRPSGQF